MFQDDFFSNDSTFVLHGSRLFPAVPKFRFLTSKRPSPAIEPHGGQYRLIRDRVSFFYTPMFATFFVDFLFYLNAPFPDFIS